METTQIIGNAVGIQYQGVTDQSGSVPVERLVNGLIVGDFGRGRVDQPMFITKDNLAQLGDESKPAYQTVSDCLDAGVPGVLVMRTSATLPVVPDCVPTNLFVPDILVEGPFSIFYRLDSDGVTGDVVEYEMTTSGAITARDALADLVVNELLGVVTDSSGGNAEFQFVAGGVAGGDGSLSATPVTLHLLTVEDAGFDPSEYEYDFIGDFGVFGGSVSVHSCGLQNWIGF